MEEAIRIKCPDILLCDINLEGGSVCSSIRKLRHNQVGQNPFCSVILFIDEPTEDVVKAASEAGLDDLQVKPIVAQKILDRIVYLVEKRKPFVVTTDYIGPDRRKDHRQGSQKISSMPVPNSVEQKANGIFVANDFQEDVIERYGKSTPKKLNVMPFKSAIWWKGLYQLINKARLTAKALGKWPVWLRSPRISANVWKKGLHTPC